jgi:hypothetical protein
MAAILKSLGDFLDNISGVPGSIGVSAAVVCYISAGEDLVSRHSHHIHSSRTYCTVFRYHCPRLSRLFVYQRIHGER